jgi:hypothetical protein
VVWLLLASAVVILVLAVVLASVLGFVRVSRELRQDDQADDYF